MEVLVQWFTENLSQYISEEMVVFIISMIPILELRGGLLATSPENPGNDCDSYLHFGKYYSDSFYSSVHQKDF